MNKLLDSNLSTKNLCRSVTNSMVAERNLTFHRLLKVKRFGMEEKYEVHKNAWVRKRLYLRRLF